jgi:hypothetical protein
MVIAGIAMAPSVVPMNRPVDASLSTIAGTHIGMPSIERFARACTVAVENTHEPAHIPAPWQVEPTLGGHFVLKDATGCSVC